MDFSYIYCRDQTFSYRTKLIMVLVFISFLQNTVYKNVINNQVQENLHYLKSTGKPKDLSDAYPTYSGLKEVPANPKTAPLFLHHNSCNIDGSKLTYCWIWNLYRFSWVPSESSAILGFECTLLSLWNWTEESTSISGLLWYYIFGKLLIPRVY
jgi:hypothetical protein